MESMPTSSLEHALLHANRNTAPLPPKQAYTVQEVAEGWSRSPDFIRDRFRNVPGILYQDRSATKKQTQILLFHDPHRNPAS